MANEAIKTPLGETDLTHLLDHYSQIYLKQYWPEYPQGAVAWADNAVLMLSYQDASLAVKKFRGGSEGSMLDVSTGPALAPLLGMLTCVSKVQLSDFNHDNRNSLQKLPIEYWRNYVPMLIKLFDYPERQASEILGRLDFLRRQSTPIEVDLFKSPPFPESIKPFEYDIISMQFVADSITKTENEYLKCLGKVTDMVRPGGAFIMSAVVDSECWNMEDTTLPSPKVSERTIVDFLAAQGMTLLHLSRSMRQPGLTYSGGWIVLSAAKPQKKK